MDDSVMITWLACICIGVIAAALIWHAERKMRRIDEARHAAKLARDMERSAEQLRRSHIRTSVQPLNNYMHSSPSTARAFASSESATSPAPAPSTDYLTQYLAWQNLTTPHTSPSPDSESSCRASSFSSGGGGDFGGGGASSSWDSGSSSDSCSSSSSDSSGSCSSD